MPEENFNFINSFIKGRKLASELETEKQNRENAQKELQIREKQVDQQIALGKANLEAARHNMRESIRQQLISGERPMMDSFQANIPEAAGLPNQQTVVNPEGATNVDFGSELGSASFSNPEILAAREQMKQQMLSGGQTAATIAGQKAGAISEAELPAKTSLEQTKGVQKMLEDNLKQVGDVQLEGIKQSGRLKLENVRGTNQASLAQNKAIDDYNRSIAVAGIHARATIEAANIRRQSQGQKPLSATQENTLADLNTLEQWLTEAKDLAEANNYSYFYKPIPVKDALTQAKRGIFGMDPANEELKAKLGNIKSLIAHPRFGGALTPGEVKILDTFTTAVPGNMPPERAKATLNEMLKFTKAKKDSLINVHAASTGRNLTSTSPGNIQRNSNGTFTIGGETYIPAQQ